MCVGTLVHISRHMGKTSINNTKRCQLWIRYMLCHVCLYRVYFGFSVLWLLYYICSYSVFPLVFYSTWLLLLSYHTMSNPCLIPFAVYLLAPSCLCLRHDFQCMFMTWIYRYTCAYLSTPSDFHITTRLGVLTPLDPHVQVLELGACAFSQLLIRVAQLRRESPADRP